MGRASTAAPGGLERKLWNLESGGAVAELPSRHSVEGRNVTFVMRHTCQRRRYAPILVGSGRSNVQRGAAAFGDPCGERIDLC